MVAAEKSDEEIAEAVQKGDHESFGILVERYEQKISRYGRKFLSDAEDIKDLIQEIFIKAYVNIRSFDTERKFSPWIYRIAHNEFINAAQKKRRIPIFSFDLDTIFPHPVAAETADSEARRHDMRKILDMHLGSLLLKYREPLILYYFQDMDYKMISEILKIPTSTVGVRLQRGKALLEQRIGRDNPIV